MMPKSIPPQLGLNSFSCPHCGAIAHQNWYTLYFPSSGSSGPAVLRYEEVKQHIARIEDEDNRGAANKFLERLKKHSLTYDVIQFGHSCDREMVNLAVSYCFSCQGFGVWIADKLLYPAVITEIEPQEDMPDEIKEDFIEAASVVDMSPRGSAALLRLCIQKLMAVLGEKGKNIDDDIGSLVKKGLRIEIKQALDVVRVIGNNAVHPGQIDLKDDKATALRLFDLVNLIVETMISAPKENCGAAREIARGSIEGD